jgi:AraC family transcriptional regulator
MGQDMDSTVKIDNWYGHGPYSSTVHDLLHVEINGLTAFEIEQPAGSYPEPGMNAILLAMVNTSAGHVRMDLGAGRFDSSFHKGSFSLTPAYTPTEIVTQHATDLMLVGLDAERVKKLAQDEMRFERDLDFGKLHGQLNNDERVELIVRSIMNELQSGLPMASMYIDSVIIALLQQLQRLAQKDRGKIKGYAKISDRSLSRIKDFMDANLNAHIRIEELAAFVGMSAFHFAHAFKNATGWSPHRYLLSRRILRAQALIKEHHSTLADISFEVGFSSQAHMTSAFKTATGLTPAQFQKA